MTKVPKPQPKIKIYITPGCPYCYTLKQFLNEKEIYFEELDVSQSEKTKEEMIKKSGRMEVPVVDIDGEIVIGFDRDKILKILKLKD